MANFFEDIGLDSVADFFGAEDRRAARRAGSQADAEAARARDLDAEARRATMAFTREARGMMGEDRERYDRLYAPMEEELAAEVSGPADTARAAQMAREEFGEQFDLAREGQRREDMRYGVQPGSVQARRSADRDVFNRARGVAGAATAARTAEADQHFLRKAAFYNQNGSGMKGDLLRQLGTIYGADYDSLQSGAASAYGSSDRYQSLSNQHAASSMGGVNTAMQLGGIAASLYTGGAFGAAAAGAGAAVGTRAATTDPVGSARVSSQKLAFGGGRVPAQTPNFNLQQRDTKYLGQGFGTFGTRRGFTRN